ncbi:hypothetical protein [Streptomyces sp. NPDC058457]|uniref:hypothetical protein n=1 Tax=Streptomyces sp. NPDC058457 TaxID=3346507 RepID=UPI0036643064
MTVLATAAAPPASCRDLPWAVARERAHEASVPLPARQVPLARAAGLTLADMLCTPQPMPGFDTAAMDGYAVGPGAGPWRVRGAVRAGSAWTGGPLDVGEAVEISTGAPVPAGARAVIPLVRIDRSGTLVWGPPLADGKHIRRAGEDASAGSPLAPAGTRVGPALLGPAAASGHDTLPVRPRPRVRVLVTGDELTHTGRPAPGRVRRPLPALPRIPLTGDIRTAPGRTRLIPVTWDGTTAQPVGGHRPAFLHGAALADALAAVPQDWRPGQPTPLLLLTG